MIMKRTRQMKANVLKHSVKIVARRVKFLATKRLRKSKRFICKTLKLIRESVTMEFWHSSDCIGGSGFRASIKIGQNIHWLRVRLVNEQPQTRNGL